MLAALPPLQELTNIRPIPHPSQVEFGLEPGLRGEASFLMASAGEGASQGCLGEAGTGQPTSRLGRAGMEESANESACNQADIILQQGRAASRELGSNPQPLSGCAGSRRSLRLSEPLSQSLSAVRGANIHQHPPHGVA